MRRDQISQSLGRWPKIHDVHDKDHAGARESSAAEARAGLAVLGAGDLPVTVVHDDFAG